MNSFFSNPKQALLLVFILLAIGLIILVGFGPTTGLISAPVQETTTIKLAYIPIPYDAPIIIALREGYFKEEGLSVEEVKATFVGHVFQGVVQNQIDVLVGGETPAMFMALKGGQFSIVGQTMVTKNDLAFIARKQANISTVQDVSGKRVGLVLTSVSHYNLWKNLVENNVDPNSVEMIDVNPANMVSALANGEVDAIYHWEPLPFKLKKSLGDSVTTLNLSSQWFKIIVTSPQFSKNTIGIEKLLRALQRGELLIQTNPERAAQIVAPELGLSSDELQEVWRTVSFDLLPFYGQDLMAKQAKWAIESKVVPATQIPDFSTFVKNQIIERTLALNQ